MITVTVYSTGDGCSWCVRTCACLRLAGIPFTLINLSASANAPLASSLPTTWDTARRPS